MPVFAGVTGRIAGHHPPVDHEQSQLADAPDPTQDRDRNRLIAQNGPEHDAGHCQVV